jgi:hypothetical protein
MVMTAAALEHLRVEEKRWVGELIAGRLKSARPSGGPWIWALGRLGSRVPLYGSAHNVIPPGLAEEWIQLLLDLDPAKIDGASFALAQMARISGDRLRDISQESRSRVLAALEGSGAPESWSRMAREKAELKTGDEARVLGDSLPIGLQIVHSESAGP